MSQVECESCKKQVPHVSRACHWCDACEEEYDRELDREFSWDLADAENEENGRWCIVGKNADGNGGGVIAWCSSQSMAQAMLPEIANDPQYTDVRVDFF